MKTNIIMNRPMGMFNVEQRTKDSMFNATSLLKQWNNNYPNDKRDLDNFWKSTQGKYFKTTKHYIANRGKYNGGTWMDSDLLLVFSKFISYKLYSVIYKYIKGTEYEYIRGEKHIISIIKEALQVCDKRYEKIKDQYKIGNYYIDLALLNNTEEKYFDDNDKTHIFSNYEYILIEYDEKHHNCKNGIIKDEKREMKIIDILKNKYKKINEEQKREIELNICIIRIKEGNEKFVYSYLIPYLLGYEVGYLYNMICKNLIVKKNKIEYFK